MHLKLEFTSIISGDDIKIIDKKLENQITKDNAPRIKAKIVLELANGPTTSEADEIMGKKGIKLIPDVLANSGGVTVSAFEWEQNIKGEKWDEENVNHKLKEKITKAFESVWNEAYKRKTDFRTAAFIVAIQRIISKIH